MQSSQALEELSSSASVDQISAWTAQMTRANLNQAGDISAMDIYYVQVKEGKKGPDTQNNVDIDP